MPQPFSALQQLINGIAGQSYWMLSGQEYELSQTLVIPPNTVIHAHGARWIQPEGSPPQTLLDPKSGVKIFGLTVEGNGSNEYDDASRLISLNNVSDVLLKDVKLKNSKAYALRANKCTNLLVENLEVHNVAYAGFMALASNQIRLKNPQMRLGNPTGFNGNSYGIAFTRDENQSIENSPVCTDWSVEGGYIEDNRLWEGFDCHGGTRGRVSGLTVKRCKIGIKAGSIGTYGCHDVIISDCIVDSELAQMTGDVRSVYGIVVHGTSTDPATGCHIKSCTVRRMGDWTNYLSGAVYAYSTDGLIVEGVSCRDCYAASLALHGNNNDFIVNGFHSANLRYDGVSRHVYLNGINNKGVLANYILRGSNEGINISPSSPNKLYLGPGYCDSTDPIIDGLQQAVRVYTPTA